MLTTLTFAVEPFRQVYDEATTLIVAHWQEIAKNKHLLRLNPDENVYEELDRQNKLLLVTARDGDKLVGYFLWFLVNHTHYKHVLTAEEDLHFLLPNYRGRGLGFQLMQAACDAARERGAELLIVREKIGHEHPTLWKRLGFVPTDVIYTFARK